MLMEFFLEFFINIMSQYHLTIEGKRFTFVKLNAGALCFCQRRFLIESICYSIVKFSV